MYDSLLETIGQTPLVRLGKIGADLPCPLYGKVESFNPGASVKDRIALAMVERAEQEGFLTPGVSTIVEPTAGNTGIGLAVMAAIRGYRCVFVLPDKMSAEKIALLHAYGAETVITPSDVPPDSPDSYGNVAERLAGEIPNAWMPDQFKNEINPQTHALTTGPEIWKQSEGRVTCFVAGIGTGGTISGVGRYLKEKNENVRIVGADPEGSILSGDEQGPFKVEGIGQDYYPKTYDQTVVDDWVRVSDAESFQMGRRLARSEGLFAGGSSGTTVAAAVRYAKGLTSEDLIVALIADTGHNYMSKMFNDTWMQENGFLEDNARSGEQE